ncbi:hypothetical protein BDZ94DRAFT_1231777 [Collybia nuda]|uniref:Uncharacterized protein n=1 Tax=Collybia nuda TaxID=64659 RepID=A0A9P5YGD0_9AGAR|nr:hypothetical protein BDZ94DRAFT_1231777 [Collybia nuda]
MAIIIPKLTVAQAATIINAIITFLQYSIGLALVALLLYCIPPFNSANSWSVAARQVHTSLWPVILRRTHTYASTRVNFFSTLSLISALLVAICGIVVPLGLKQGPPVHSFFHPINASFIQDTSPLGLATSPRQDFKFGRICGGISQVLCPGNTPETINRTEIPPSVFETFSSTPHGPFNMEFRRYFINNGGYNFSMAKAQIGIVQSLILQEGIFAADGLIIDMTETPGIGFSNHTIPSLGDGSTWSQEMFWLEPVTTCVNTNLTIDYIRVDEFGVDNFNLTDRGGFANLTTEYPQLSRDGQNINLYEHAYKGAVLGNFFTMMGFNNMTRNESFVGKTYLLNRSSTSYTIGDMTTGDLSFLQNATLGDPDTSCRGFGGADNANITNVGVQCGGFAGPAQRTDGGDERIPSMNSTWTQSIHVCASTTRASIQTVTFTINSTRDLRDLQITRKISNTSVLWAVEKTDLMIRDVDLFWGHVVDKYESDPSLWTIRSNALYVPAGGSDSWGVTGAGQPSTVPAAAWAKVYALSSLSDFDYSGKTNFALLTKWQSLLAKNPETGNAQIRNLIWTDMVANSLVGTETHSTLVAASLEPSVTYDLRYAIPLLLLFIIWVPSFLASTFILVLGRLKVTYLRDFIDHTAVGRLALGDSALAPVDMRGGSEPVHLNEGSWRKAVGKTIVSFRSIINVRRSGGETFYDKVPKSPAASD